MFNSSKSILGHKKLLRTILILIEVFFIVTGINLAGISLHEGMEKRMLQDILYKMVTVVDWTFLYRGIRDDPQLSKTY